MATSHWRAFSFLSICCLAGMAVGWVLFGESRTCRQNFRSEVRLELERWLASVPTGRKKARREVGRVAFGLRYTCYTRPGVNSASPGTEEKEEIDQNSAGPVLVPCWLLDRGTAKLVTWQVWVSILESQAATRVWDANEMVFIDPS